MLQTLLLGSVLSLLAVSPGQAEIPIQANFDAGQVCPRGPSQTHPFLPVTASPGLAPSRVHGAGKPSPAHTLCDPSFAPTLGMRREPRPPAPSDWG